MVKILKTAAQYINRYLAKRDNNDVSRLKSLLKYTTCSTCGKTLKKCRCPYGAIEIDMLCRSFLKLNDKHL